ncbi:MAG: glycosyltransferase family 4 protein [Bdellovibrionota bacterium]
MNVKRKILIVNSSISGGGAGKALIYLLRCLDQKHVQTHVMIPSDGVIGEEIKKMNVPIHYFKMLPERFSKTQYEIPKLLRKKWIQRALNVVLMPYFAYRIAKLAKQIDADAICSNHQYHIPICVGAGYLSGKSVIIYSRDYVEGFWPKLCFRTLAKFKRVKKIFSISKVAGELYADLPKLTILQDCYDFESFGQASAVPQLRKEFDIPQDRFVFGYIGRIVQRKGVDFLIRAFANVHKQFPNTHLAIVGGNDPGLTVDLIQQYKDLASHLGIAAHVTFTGFQQDVRGMTYDFDTFVMPSLNPEPFGLVYLEAVICKVPCIVPDNSGAAEVVTHGKHGYIFKGMDQQSLEKTMIEVMNHQAQFDSIIQEAYSNAKARFDVKDRSQGVTRDFSSAMDY